MTTTKTSKGKGNLVPVQAKRDELAAKKRIWDREKCGNPTCCICLDLAQHPVRLPCTCASLMCLGCFEAFMKDFSNCLVCRERIVPRLRKLCNGRDLSCLVDVELGQWIDMHCRDKDGTDDTLVTRESQSAPAPGELKAELDKLNAQFEKTHVEEENATRLLLDKLKATGDLDLAEIERLRGDEELARRLQGFDVVTEDGKELVVVLDEENDLEPRVEPKTSSSLHSRNTKKRVFSRKDDASASKVVKHQVTWTCAVCTYDMTDIKWLRCEMCDATRSGPPTSLTASPSLRRESMADSRSSWKKMSTSSLNGMSMNLTEDKLMGHDSTDGSRSMNSAPTTLRGMSIKPANNLFRDTSKNYPRSMNHPPTSLDGVFSDASMDDSRSMNHASTSLNGMSMNRAPPSINESR